MPCSQNNKTFESKSSIKKKCKLESSGKKYIRTTKGTLLARSLDAVVDKLQKGCLQ